MSKIIDDIVIKCEQSGLNTITGIDEYVYWEKVIPVRKDGMKYEGIACGCNPVYQ